MNYVLELRQKMTRMSPDEAFTPDNTVPQTNQSPCQPAYRMFLVNIP